MQVQKFGSANKGLECVFERGKLHRAARSLVSLFFVGAEDPARDRAHPEGPGPVLAGAPASAFGSVVHDDAVGVAHDLRLVKLLATAHAVAGIKTEISHLVLKTEKS